MLRGVGFVRAGVWIVAMSLAVVRFSPALAQDASPAPTKRATVSHNAPPSPNSTVNLINLLVKQGVLTEEQASDLIKQADDEAYVARQSMRDAASKADDAEKTATTAANAVSPPGTKRVTYVPEIVKRQLREEIKQEVMARAEKERWAAPGALPEWTQRIRISGDIRLRYEGDFFPKGNDPLAAVNYNAINTGSPYNTLDPGQPNGNPYYWPTYNTDKNRERGRVRARLGLDADLFSGFYAGLRIATGDTNSPVSFNQTFGASGGNFSKYGLWLDRAFVKYNPIPEVRIDAGRFDNPFFSPTDLVFYRDLGFDGFAARFGGDILPTVSPFVVAGIFPIFNTDFNAGTNLDFNTGLPAKAPSHDKWMAGAQVGSSFRPVPEVGLTVGAAYYDFSNVQGQLSSTCIVFAATDVCNTDLTRPSFAQKGNTYMALRNIPQLDANGNVLPQYQFFGLAANFKDLVVSASLDLGYFSPVHIVLDGEYVRNLAWNRSDIAAKVAANPIPAGPTFGCASLPCPPVYSGGNQGWLARVAIGYRELKALGDWNAFAGYKYLESDAVIDAFTDSDFGLGGTNLKGYFVGASVGVGPNVWLTSRWMSANQVAGAPFAVDIVQVDLNARF